MKLLMNLFLKVIAVFVLIWCVLFVIAVAVTTVLGPWPESAFQLAPESRLPRWFTHESVGLSRPTVVSVHMAYYTGVFSRRAIFTLRDSRGTKLAEVEGRQRGLRPYSKGDNHYPSYEVITVGPVTEIIEHRAMEPVFYITDDRAVREWLGVK